MTVLSGPGAGAWNLENCLCEFTGGPDSFLNPPETRVGDAAFKK